MSIDYSSLKHPPRPDPQSEDPRPARRSIPTLRHMASDVLEQRAERIGRDAALYLTVFVAEATESRLPENVVVGCVRARRCGASGLKLSWLVGLLAELMGARTKDEIETLYRSVRKYRRAMGKACHAQVRQETEIMSTLPERLHEVCQRLTPLSQTAKGEVPTSPRHYHRNPRRSS